jgi:hypothetical protein
LITGFINTKGSNCYTVLILQKFTNPLNLAPVENGPPLPAFAPSLFEECIAAQALAIDLKAALLACFSGAESRRWTVGELFSRLQNLGVPCSRLSVTGALSELEVELDLCPWAPWRLVERGPEWALEPRSELAELLSGVRKLPLAEAARLSEGHKAVLLVVIGHRRRGGVSKTRIGDILGVDASPYLEELARLHLVYADPARELRFWRPRPEALLALGFRSGADIPELKELEDWFDSRRDEAALAKSRPARRRNRELKRRESVAGASGERSKGAGGETFAGGKEGPTDFLGGEAPLPHPG